MPLSPCETSTDAQQQLLVRRAKALARPLNKTTALADVLTVVAFDLAAEQYAVEFLFVQEVCALKLLTRVPCTPAFIAGIINIRGNILSVIDLKNLLCLPQGELTNAARILILADHNTEMGVIADGVSGIRTVRRSELQPGVAGLDGGRREYLQGIGPHRLIVLHARAMLADRKLLVQDELE